MREAYLVFRLIEVAAKACREELQRQAKPRPRPGYILLTHSGGSISDQPYDV